MSADELIRKAIDMSKAPAKPERPAPAMKAKPNGDPERCLGCGGAIEDGYSYWCSPCVSDDGVSPSLAAEWERGARDFPRKHAKVDDGTPEAWPEVTVGSRWTRWFAGVQTHAELAVESVSKHGPVVMRTDSGPYLGDARAFMRGGWNGIEYRPHRTEAPAVPPLCEVAAPLKHDFSDPYCATRRGRMCVGCGAGLWLAPPLDETCFPVTGWREQFERQIADDMSPGMDVAQQPGPYAIRPVQRSAVQSHAFVTGGVWRTREGG